MKGMAHRSFSPLRTDALSLDWRQLICIEVQQEVSTSSSYSPATTRPFKQSRGIGRSLPQAHPPQSHPRAGVGPISDVTAAYALPIDLTPANERPISNATERSL